MENPGDGLTRKILAWYEVSARALPWRQPPGVLQDPYRVWLSEIMLQQTTVKAVIPYYTKFLARWPSVTDLATAELDDVLAAWAGLGYYSRARNLHACAVAVSEQHCGAFPRDTANLLKLPGIGAYTAAAIAAIAFGEPATAVDGNIERVVARLFAVDDPLPGAKPEIKTLAASLVSNDRPGDYTQAMMDLGATICSPRSPSCAICPVIAHCDGQALGIAQNLPVKAPKKERPTRYGTAFLAIDANGEVLLRRRPPKGLLGGMLEVPSTDWSEARIDHAAALADAPLQAEWRLLTGQVEHTFTHFHLILNVCLARNVRRMEGASSWIWHKPEELPEAALPSIMRKVLAHGINVPPAPAGKALQERLL